jgi:hypothetical protein
MTEAEYRAHPAVNFSSLSWLATSPRVYYQNKYNPVEEEDKSYFAVGGAIDTIMTQSWDEFKKQYHILKSPRPTGKLEIVIEKFLLYHLEKGVSKDVAFDAAYEAAEYKVSKDKIRENMEANAYFRERMDYHGKKRIITYDEYKLINNLVETINKHDRAKKWFTPKEGVEITYQFPIIFNIAGRDCKALLDILYIDHKEQVICPVDLKTTGSDVEEFSEKFKKFKYYIQAAFYTEAVKQWVIQQRIIKNEPTLYYNYVIEPFRFLVLEKVINGVPLLYQCTENAIKCGTYGGNISGRYIKGYLELVQDLIWHEQTGIWNVRRSVYEANYEIPLDPFRNDEAPASAGETTEIPSF